MKVCFFIFIFLVFANSSYAQIQFKIIGACSKEPILNEKVSMHNANNVGAFTIERLIKNNLEHIGDQQKLESIDSSPVGEKALEIINRKEMRAYGWCFYVNGEQPEVYPHKIKMNPNINSVTWVFAYAYYKDGEWLSMCEHSWKIKPPFLCE